MVEKEGIEFTLTRGSPPSISTFEQALEDIKSMYEAQFGHLVAEEVVEKDGITLDEIKSLYETKFGHSFAEEMAEKDGFEFIVTRGETLLA